MRLAIDAGHLELAKLLLQHGADVHADNDYALRRAVQNRDVELVILVLWHGADVSKVAHPNTKEFMLCCQKILNKRKKDQKKISSWVEKI